MLDRNSLRRGNLRAAAALALCVSLCPKATLAAGEANGAAPGAPPPGVLLVPFSPTVFITADGQALLMLNAPVAQAQGGSPLAMAYLASVEVSMARAADAQERAAATARALLEALGPVVRADAREAVVTAVFGAPASWGAGIPVRAVRTAEGWRALEPDGLRPMVVPTLPLPLERQVEAERAAVAAATSFLERSDERDGDGVWELASAAIKARMSRRAFEEALWPTPSKQPRAARRARFSNYLAHAGEFTLGDLYLVCLESDHGIEVVQLRLDDDQEWRVLDIGRPVAVRPRAKLTAAAGPSARPGAGPFPGN